MQPIVYNSLDTNAPKLDITAGSLRTILKACLITGYGNQPSAGWEIVWEDSVANKMAIRSKNPTSIKSILSISDAEAKKATVQTFNSWDIANNVGNGLFGNGYFIKDWNNTGKSRAWYLLATDKFFYLMIQSEAGGGWYEIVGFGDGKPLKKDMFYSALLAHKVESYTAAGTGHTGVQLSSSETAIFPRNLFDSAQAYWGDGYNFQSSKIPIFSECALCVSGDPRIQLYGMLMPHSGIDYTLTPVESNMRLLRYQIPYANSIVVVQQSSNGRIFIHTDDWGL